MNINNTRISSPFLPPCSPPFLSKGMTLIELIAVMTILGIVASISTAFIVNSMRGYRDMRHHVEMVQKGRQVVERISRELRVVVPGTARVQGSCLEYFPISASGRYFGDVSGIAVDGIDLQTFSLAAGEDFDQFVNVGGGKLRISIGATSPSDFYDNASSYWVRPDLTKTQTRRRFLFTSTSFSRDSSANRVYFMHDYYDASGTGSGASQLCVETERLILRGYRWRTNANYTQVLATGVKPATTGSPYFQIQNGVLTRNSVVNIRLPLIDPTGQDLTPITFNHQVMLRNVQ